MANYNKIDYGEQTCDAISIIVKSALEGLAFDRTILCTIDSLYDAEPGRYRVFDNSTKFDAYGTDEYKVGDNVYVSIPCGDWNEQKLIVGKRASPDEKYINTLRPFDSFVNITGNLIEGEILGSQTGLIANDIEKQSILIYSYNIPNSGAIVADSGSPIAEYTRLGLQAGFQSLLSNFVVGESGPYNVDTGDYGLKLTLIAIRQSGEQSQVNEYTCILNQNDMIGNPYDFDTFSIQEKIFDIKEIGAINKIKLEFFQTPGTFKDSAADVYIPTKISDFGEGSVLANLHCNDVLLAFGKDISEFADNDASIYTLNGDTFSPVANPITDNHKELQLRWIHKFDNGRIKAVTSSDLSELGDFRVQWYRYQLGAAAGDSYSDVYWILLSEQEYKNGNLIYNIQDPEWQKYNQNYGITDYQPGFFSTWAIPNVDLNTEQYKAIIFYNDEIYRSPILTLTNKQLMQNSSTSTLTSSLRIHCDDETFGNYRVYNLDYSLAESFDITKPRTFTIQWHDPYNPTAEYTTLSQADSITWKLPTSNSMLDFNITDDGNNIGYDERGNYILFTKYKDNTGYIDPTLSYYIRRVYNPSYNNNTVQCVVEKNNITYTATLECIFGVKGNTGTDYSFILNFEDHVAGVVPGGKVKVKAFLYDADNNEIDLSNTNIEWKWKDESSYHNKMSFAQLTSDRVEISALNQTIDNKNYHILEANLNWGGTEDKSWVLTAYLPIPIRNQNYSHIRGLTQLVYNSAGLLISSVRDHYDLFKLDGNSIYDTTSSYTCVWEINNAISEAKYTPKMKTQKLTYNTTTKQRSFTGYFISPLNFYVEDANQYLCLTCKYNNSVVWSQPILTVNSTYPSGIVNKWNGQLDVGELDEGTILAPRLVAGKKESNNTFTGVLMGDWSSSTSSPELSANTGVYGFYEGAQVYAFKDNGTAFIGKAGTGRIEFDTRNGTAIIKSQAYDDYQQGMELDLTNGIINAHQFHLNAGSYDDYVNHKIDINTEATDYPLQLGSWFKVDWKGSLIASSATITGDIIGSNFYLPTKENPNFHIDSQGNMYVGDINLENNTAIFKLTNQGYLSMTQGSITLGTTKNGEPAFKVTDEGEIAAQKGRIGGWHIHYDTTLDTSGRGWNMLYSKDHTGQYYFAMDGARDNVLAIGVPRDYFEKDHNYAPFRVLNDGTLLLGGKPATFEAKPDGTVTATNIIITGGSFTIDGDGDGDAYFSITEDGRLLVGGSADNPNFKVTNTGAVTATNLSITGGEITIGGSAESPNFKVDSTGKLTAAAGKFIVDTNGSLTLKGDLTIAENATGAEVFWINSNSTNKYVLGVGGEESDPNFQINKSGIVRIGGTYDSPALKISDNGQISVNDGVFLVTNTGDVTLTGSNFKVRSSNKKTVFEVKADGTMTLTDGTISGGEIIGGKFYGLDEGSYLEIGTAPNGSVAYINHYVGTTRVATLGYKTNAFIYDGSYYDGWLLMYGTGYASMAISKTANNIALTKTSGIWDFSGATTKGIYARFA